jgi:hypothetical protein
MDAAATPLPARQQRRPARIDRHLQCLDQAIDAGMGMISALAAQVAGTGPQVVEGDVALAYSRFFRAVRQGILLQTHLLEEPEEKAEPDAEAVKSAKGERQQMYVTWLEPEQSKREGRRERVAQIVERMARSDGEPEETVERLYREAVERLERVDIYGDPAFRPISEMVAEICRDLGLKPDWAVLSTHPWAKQEIALGEKSKDKGGEDVGWPLKGGPPPPEDWRGPWPPKALSRHTYGHPFPNHHTRPAALAELEYDWHPPAPEGGEGAASEALDDSS